MENSPWTTLGSLNITPPLHNIPKHPERWLPKYNAKDGLPTEEHIHNFMVVINLNGVSKEDYFFKLFPLSKVKLDHGIFLFLLIQLLIGIFLKNLF